MIDPSEEEEEEEEIEPFYTLAHKTVEDRRAGQSFKSVGFEKEHMIVTQAMLDRCKYSHWYWN